MHVVIVDSEFKKARKFQIMRRAGSYGVDHVFPGKLFTLEQAREICAAHGFIIDAVGSLYQVTEN